MKPKIILFLLFSCLYGCVGESYSPFIATRDAVINNKIQGTWVAKDDNGVALFKIFSVGEGMWGRYSNGKNALLVPLTFDTNTLQGFFQVMDINSEEGNNGYLLFHYHIEANQLTISGLKDETIKYIAEHNDIKINDKDIILKGYGSQAYQAIKALPVNNRFYHDAVKFTKIP